PNRDQVVRFTTDGDGLAMHRTNLDLPRALMTVVPVLSYFMKIDTIVIGHERLTQTIDNLSIRRKLETRKHRFELFDNAIQRGEKLWQMICFVAHARTLHPRSVHVHDALPEPLLRG